MGAGMAFPGPAAPLGVVPLGSLSENNTHIGDLEPWGASEWQSRYRRQPGGQG